MSKNPNHRPSFHIIQPNPLQQFFHPPGMIRHMNSRRQSIVTPFLQELHIQPLHRNQRKRQVIKPFRVPTVLRRRINTLVTKLPPSTLPRPHRANELIPLRIIRQPAQSPSLNDSFQPRTFIMWPAALCRWNFSAHSIEPLSLDRTSRFRIPHHFTRRTSPFHFYLSGPGPPCGDAASVAAFAGVSHFAFAISSSINCSIAHSLVGPEFA